MSLYYKITLGDVSKVVPAAQAMDTADQMVNQAGGGIPNIVPCDEQGNTEIKKEETKVETPAPKVNSTWTATVIDNTAKARIEAQHQALAAQGIKVNTKEQFYATGTRMADVGYTTQTHRKQEFLKQKPLKDAIGELSEKVGNELRRDVHLSAKEIAEELTVEDNQILVRDHLLTERALRGIVARLQSPAIGYLVGLQERIAGEQDAKLLQTDIEKLTDIFYYECKRFGDVEFKLRMREYPRDIFAALSPTFGVADAPMVMDQIIEQMPEDARGSWSYDPETTSWELRAEIFTPTPVEEQAVGEAFSGYVSFSSGDAGNLRFRGGGGISLIRCLNASTYSAGEGISRVHRGKIMYDINSMTAKSLKAIKALCVAWGKNRQEKVEIPTGVKISDAIPGFWRFLLTDKRSELQGVLKGRTENNIGGLTQAFYSERRDLDNVVRADFAQGFTRFIQGQPTEIRREAELAIGNWVVNNKPMRCELKEK